jgi:hypothetical protein
MCSVLLESETVSHPLALLGGVSLVIARPDGSARWWVGVMTIGAAFGGGGGVRSCSSIVESLLWLRDGVEGVSSWVGEVGALTKLESLIIEAMDAKLWDDAVRCLAIRAGDGGVTMLSVVVAIAVDRFSSS